MGLSQSHFWRLKNLVISTTKNKKILFLKIYEEMETKLSILVMKNVLVTCFFYKHLLNLYLSIFIFCVYISRYCYKLCFCYTLQFSLYYSSLLVIFFPYEDQKIEVSDSLVTELVQVFTGRLSYCKVNFKEIITIIIPRPEVSQNLDSGSRE